MLELFVVVVAVVVVVIVVVVGVCVCVSDGWWRGGSLETHVALTRFKLTVAHYELTL